MTKQRKGETLRKGNEPSEPQRRTPEGSEAGEDVSWLMTADDVAVRCKMGRSTWWKLHAAGKTPRPRKLGGTTRWARDEIVAWIDAGCPPRERWEQR